MNSYSSDIWGEIPEPESFVELISLITKNTFPGINVSYWRGQSNIDWKIDSSMVRKIKKDARNSNKQNKNLDQSVLYWEKILISEAKKNLYNYDDSGRKLGDIELLAKLQHYGAATRLLDFSKNVLIALWFCVSATDDSDRTGLLLGIDTTVISGMENKFDFEKDYETFVNDVCESEAIWLVDPPANVQRIVSQNSVFLCSKSVTEKHGSFLLPKEECYKKIIAISPKLKEDSLKMLSECFNITPFTIYPDIEGFANAYSVKWPVSKFTRW